MIKAKGLTQKEFAQAINLAPSTITEYFAGRANPSDKVLKLISKFFGVSYEWLKEGKGERLFKADGKFILLSDNPSYPPIYPEEEGYRVIGIAIEYYRKGKL